MRVFYFSADKKRGGITRPLFCPYSLYSLLIILMKSHPAIVLATVLSGLRLSLDTGAILAKPQHFTSQRKPSQTAAETSPHIIKYMIIS